MQKKREYLNSVLLVAVAQRDMGSLDVPLAN